MRMITNGRRYDNKRYSTLRHPACTLPDDTSWAAGGSNMLGAGSQQPKKHATDGLPTRALTGARSALG